MASRRSAAARRHKFQPRGHIPKEQHKLGPRGVPPISIDVEDMSDRALLTLSAIEDHSAREEILKRHIMDVDHVTYCKANEIFNIISNHNMRGYYLVSLPYKVGIVSASMVAAAAPLMVFHLPVIEWFNALAVTTDVPELRDLETPLEVSIWAWNWMEPPLGTLSFLLLCMQYIRGQMVNLGIKPYTGWIKGRRGNHLADSFSKYDRKILIAYSETARLVDATNDINTCPPESMDAKSK